MKKINIFKLWPLIIFTFALAVRFIFLNQFQASPFFDVDVKGVDPSLYHEWAKELAEGYWPGYRLLYGHPFYPYVVSFIYRIFAADSYIVTVFQCLSGALSSVLIYFIARRLFSRPAGIIASVLAALYAPFLFYEGLLVPNTLAILLNLSAFLMLLNILDWPNVRRTFLAGLLLGCSLITNSGIAPFIIVSFFWMVFALRKNKKAVFTHAACILVGIALPLAMISLKHFTAEGRFDTFGAHGGINFYVGNNPEANGAFRAPMGFTPSAEGLSMDSAKYASDLSGRELSAKEVSEFWYKRAFSYIKSHPFLWLKLQMRKFILFWNGAELGDVADYYLSKQYSSLLKFNPFIFGLIGPLGLLGMFLARKKPTPGVFLLYTGVFGIMSSCILFFVNSRYRLSVVPYLLMFSGFALYRLWQELRNKNLKYFKVPLALFILFFVFSNVRAISADSTTPLYNLSVIYAKKEMYDEAIGISKKLLKQDWQLPMVHFNLGVCYYGKKEMPEAISEFKQALLLSPEHHDSHFNLGMIYYNETKDLVLALREFKLSIRGNEKDLAAHYWIGKIYQDYGKFDSAAEEFKAALKINPEVEQVKKALKEVSKYNLLKAKK
ncbi:MAG: hypothetical protein COW11_05480 [Candidatus Omnitrophica bacterium CG12_big_fil_rev_8_21_14_0_65_43_15]|uniref:Glycosyltransferase RgtA/B/C/D-like domain-containing protein n=1 Tax=Candidatus Taenaricola geysiri TaxID=1974752 RepID=A0A2J0LGQ3_9BACT|nr:MAG: hypothetical protein AUJ89_04965 [Candidatus Omnitrophica bacterium CG1_02_43_210]PIV11675.1 MAG: hypothetical protein COS48_04840 [Candidatus Omnitrophica bacterium CG03_land_8_20_14_0_80_43_22]PIW66034.1 MAG: hypothetical protein COW11_05480 [Candidatus Omnitrophica bacterium CG12_big_fil_rev_8_21_14_0_65_43_15]PIW80168.1 MAG: hypothetical protein COZ98_03695 [Candidatus Omnitrophica bacterium CG_4_8_14_3_um_filter_43_15]PIY84527.1 MAG: hypothetical protein COY77_01980 [Candidatus Omn